MGSYTVTAADKRLMRAGADKPLVHWLGRTKLICAVVWHKANVTDFSLCCNDLALPFLKEIYAHIVNCAVNRIG